MYLQEYIRAENQKKHYTKKSGLQASRLFYSFDRFFDDGDERGSMKRFDDHVHDTEDFLLIACGSHCDFLTSIVGQQ